MSSLRRGGSTVCGCTAARVKIRQGPLRNGCCGVTFSPAQAALARAWRAMLPAVSVGRSSSDAKEEV